MSTSMSCSKFFTQMIDGYKKQNSKSLTSLLKTFFDKGNQFSKQQWTKQFNFEPYLNIDNMTPTYFNILEALQEWQLERFSNLTLNTYFDSYLQVLELCLTYLDGMAKNNFWFSPCIKLIVMKSKYVLNQTKKREVNEVITTKSLERLVQQLRDFKASNSIDEDIKKSFQLMINNLLVSCYLNIRDYTKSKKIIDDKGIQRDLKSFSQNEINNYHFQAARIEIANKLYTKAVTSLESIKFTTNRQRNLILKYLIPCNLYAWKTPSSDLLFPEYKELSNAIVSGNFGDYNALVSAYKMLWIRRGIFELVTGLQIMVWRNFLKRVRKILTCDAIQMSQLVTATRLMGVEMNAEECLFHVTNLLNKEYLKGHIYVASDGQKTLTFRLNKGEVFPKTIPK